MSLLKRSQYRIRSIYETAHACGSKVRTYANGLGGTTEQTPKGFFIFCQGRTGSTLLCNLLDKHPRIHCDREILSQERWNPVWFVTGKRNRAEGVSRYGFKAKIYQLTNQQRLEDPAQFVYTLANRGWDIIYLWRRNVLRHSFSGHIAAAKDLWHAKKKDAAHDRKVKKSVHVDPDALLRDAYQRQCWLNKEREILEHVNYFEINYEDDLMEASARNEMLKKLCVFLNIEPMTFQPDTKRTVNKLSDQVSNYSSIVDKIKGTELETML